MTTDRTSGRERRNPQAGALRALFREQWDHLLGLLGAARARAERAEIDAAVVEDVVAGTDPRLRAVSRYRERLRAGARATLDHVTGVVAALPPPVPISRRSFRDDQHVNALFSSPRAIANVLGSNSRLLDLFPGPRAAGDELAYFTLLATRSEKTVLGLGSSGSLLVRDVMQTNVGFDNHAVVGPAGTEAQARANLEAHLFDELVAHLKRRMARLTTDHATTGAKGCAPDAAPRRSLPSRLAPEAYLAELTRLLDQPGQHLRVRTGRLVVSKLGVKLDAPSAEPANTLDLSEFGVGDRPPRILTLASYPRSEMLSPRERSARARRLVASL